MVINPESFNPTDKTVDITIRGITKKYSIIFDSGMMVADFHVKINGDIVCKGIDHNDVFVQIRHHPKEKTEFLSFWRGAGTFYAGIDASKIPIKNIFVGLAGTAIRLRNTETADAILEGFIE